MHLLLQVTAAWLIIIIAAQVCGRLAPRIGQPVVVGEMVAGVLLGPSALGALFPQFTDYAFSADVKPVLYVIAMFGLSLFMFLVGAEHHHETGSRKEAAMPVALGIAGVILPIGIGALAVTTLVDRYRPDSISPEVFILFVAGSLSVTAFPMLARILQQRGMVHTRFGSTATRAAAIDDALAWCCLAIVSAMAIHGSAASSWQTIVPAVAFLVASFWILPKLFRKQMERAVEVGRIEDGLLASMFCLVLAAGWFTDFIGIYSVFGGFIAGMALPRVPGFAPLLNARTLQMTRCLLLPVFFAYSGLNTDLTVSLHFSSLTTLLLLFSAALVSKTIASLAVLKTFRWTWAESLAMSGLMNARGLMILIYINIGLNIGIIETELFTILVIVAVLTTALAMPIYRLYFTNDREDLARESSENRMEKAMTPL